MTSKVVEVAFSQVHFPGPGGASAMAGWTLHQARMRGSFYPYERAASFLAQTFMDVVVGRIIGGRRVGFPLPAAQADLQRPQGMPHFGKMNLAGPDTYSRLAKKITESGRSPQLAGKR